MMRYELTISGGFASDLRKIKGDIPKGTPVFLIREPENSFDPCAVKVCIPAPALKDAGLAFDGDLEMYRLGYIPAKKGALGGRPFNWAAAISRLLAAGETVTAEFLDEGPSHMVRVAIHLDRPVDFIEDFV